jgi:hypothetical protein
MFLLLLRNSVAAGDKVLLFSQVLINKSSAHSLSSRRVSRPWSSWAPSSSSIGEKCSQKVVKLRTPARPPLSADTGRPEINIW